MVAVPIKKEVAVAPFVPASTTAPVVSPFKGGKFPMAPLI